MNAQPIRPRPMGRSVTFKAWRNDRPVTEPIDCACLEEAAHMLAASSPKGTVLAILMHDAGRNKRTLALYKVRESTKRYTWRASTNGGRPVKVGALEPVLLHVLDVHAFEPVEAFDALRDCPVGVDRSLVEVRP